MVSEALLTAAVLDGLLGEPSTHPVHLMGTYLAAVRTRGGGRWFGAAAVAGGCVAWAVAGGFVARAMGILPAPWLFEGALLKPTFAVRALLEAASQVRRALEASDLPGARTLVGTHLVSRPTHDLEPSEVAGAAIESLAENFTDSVVAPLLWAAIGGVGLAYAYRFLNTADAILGYRTPEMEKLGSFAARADDVANLLPARLATLLLTLAAPVGRGSSRGAASAAFLDHGRTASPNAGWTMAAMAGALGVRLTKRGAYVLHAGGRPPDVVDVRRAGRVVLAASVAMVFLAAVCAALSGAAV